MTLQLYSYWRSSTSYKVRIALNVKKIKYEIIPVHLLDMGGRQHEPEYRVINPMASVPTLIDDGMVLTQSNAILEYLEERYPAPALLPQYVENRAYLRQIMNVIACDIHPLNNLRVLQSLKKDLKVNDESKKKWYHRWINNGFGALEEMIGQSKFYSDNGFCSDFGISYAECTLIPQIYNAERFDVDMARYPILSKINENCLTLDVFEQASPENQPDAQKE